MQNFPPTDSVRLLKGLQAEGRVFECGKQLIDFSLGGLLELSPFLLLGLGRRPRETEFIL